MSDFRKCCITSISLIVAICVAPLMIFCAFKELGGNAVLYFPAKIAEFCFGVQSLGVSEGTAVLCLSLAFFEIAGVSIMSFLLCRFILVQSLGVSEGTAVLC